MCWMSELPVSVVGAAGRYILYRFDAHRTCWLIWPTLELDCIVLVVGVAGRYILYRLDA